MTQNKVDSFTSHYNEPIMGSLVRNVNPGCIHYGSEGIAVKLKDLGHGMGTAVGYLCTNSGDNWSVGDLLYKTLDQIHHGDD
jgi:hypothetical protein